VTRIPGGRAGGPAADAVAAVTATASPFRSQAATESTATMLTY
jgi:hypothetical protein